MNGKTILLGAVLFGAGYGLYRLSLVYTGLQIFTVVFILLSMLGLISFAMYAQGVSSNG